MLPTIFRRPRLGNTLVPFSREVDRTFDELMDWWRGNGHSVDDETAAYPVDVREDDGHIMVEAELPGFGKNEIDARIDQGILTITAEHKEEKKPKGKSHLHERCYRRIERSFTLPVAVDEKEVEATLADGVLHMKLRKVKEAMPHKIAVK
jgi:HSP20 family protein